MTLAESAKKLFKSVENLEDMQWIGSLQYSEEAVSELADFINDNCEHESMEPVELGGDCTGSDYTGEPVFSSDITGDECQTCLTVITEYETERGYKRLNKIINPSNFNKYKLIAMDLIKENN